MQRRRGSSSAGLRFCVADHVEGRARRQDSTPLKAHHRSLHPGRNGRFGARDSPPKDDIEVSMSGNFWEIVAQLWRSYFTPPQSFETNSLAPSLHGESAAPVLLDSRVGGTPPHTTEQAVQIYGISNSYEASGVQKALMSLVHQASAGTQNTGQVLPGNDQDSDDGGPRPPPPKSNGQASSQFASSTLASLLSVQQQPSASDFASKLIGQVDANGDGSLSLDEIKATLEKAGLTKTSSASGSSGTDPLADAFGKLDSNQDGKLDTSELTSALETMMKAHHGHRHGPPPPPQEATSAVATTDGTATAPSSAIPTVSTSAAAGG
ncbi:MAG: hypothetical protein CGW95_10120 [Phenylobacterium zucineum]|nr:MAG: hypothetical protein CGW95_10120 [Phenylobacterium zucineum]